MRIRDWSSDVCSSDLHRSGERDAGAGPGAAEGAGREEGRQGRRQGACQEEAGGQEESCREEVGGQEDDFQKACSEKACSEEESYPESQREIFRESGCRRNGGRLILAGKKDPAGSRNSDPKKAEGVSADRKSTRLNSSH